MCCVHENLEIVLTSKVWEKIILVVFVYANAAVSTHLVLFTKYLLRTADVVCFDCAARKCWSLGACSVNLQTDKTCKMC